MTIRILSDNNINGLIPASLGILTQITYFKGGGDSKLVGLEGQSLSYRQSKKKVNPYPIGKAKNGWRTFGLE